MYITHILKVNAILQYYMYNYKKRKHRCFWCTWSLKYVLQMKREVVYIVNIFCIHEMIGWPSAFNTTKNTVLYPSIQFTLFDLPIRFLASLTFSDKPLVLIYTDILLLKLVWFTEKMFIWEWRFYHSCTSPALQKLFFYECFLNSHKNHP